MAKYARTEGTITHLWLVERRGHTLWTREGKAGAKGRIQSHAHATDEAASTALATMIAARERDGYVLVDAASGVSSPLRLPRATAGSHRRGGNAAGGLDPSELHRRLVTRLTPTAAWTVRDIANAVREIAATPCTWRLARLEFFAEEDGSRVRFGVGHVDRVTSNPDDADHDEFDVLVELPPHTRNDLEDEVVLDVFADELRLSPAALAARFGRALDQLAVFRELAGATARSVTVRSSSDE